MQFRLLTVLFVLTAFCVVSYLLSARMWGALVCFAFAIGSVVVLRFRGRTITELERAALGFRSILLFLLVIASVLSVMAAFLSNAGLADINLNERRGYAIEATIICCGTALGILGCAQLSHPIAFWRGALCLVLSSATFIGVYVFRSITISKSWTISFWDAVLLAIPAVAGPLIVIGSLIKGRKTDS